MKWTLVGLIALWSISSPAFAGNPWEELMGPGKANTWTDPEGRFSIDLPVNWKAQDGKKATLRRFSKTNTDHRQTGLVTVEMRTLPPGVRLSHFSLHAEAEFKKSAPNLRKGQTNSLLINGIKARKTEYSYQERGHAHRTNYTSRVILVSGERGWIITFLSAYGAQGLFLEEFDKMVNSFNPGQLGRPVKRGKKRKKLRAGEMVNPNLLKY